MLWIKAVRLCASLGFCNLASAAQKGDSPAAAPSLLCDRVSNDDTLPHTTDFHDMPTVHSTRRRSAAAEHAALLPIVIKTINDTVMEAITESHNTEAAEFEAKPEADRSYDSTAHQLVAFKASRYVRGRLTELYQGARRVQAERRSPISARNLVMHSAFRERISNEDLQKLVDDFYLGATRQYELWREGTGAPGASLICKVTSRMTELDNGGVFLTLAFWFFIAA